MFILINSMAQNKDVPVYYFHGVNDFGYMWNGYTPYLNNQFYTLPSASIAFDYTDKNVTDGGDGIAKIAEKLLSTGDLNQRSINLNTSQTKIAIGHSMGGLVARSVYAQNPKALGGLISIGTPHLGGEIARGIYDVSVKDNVLNNIILPSYDKSISLAKKLKEVATVGVVVGGVVVALGIATAGLLSSVSQFVGGYIVSKSINGINKSNDAISKAETARKNASTELNKGFEKGERISKTRGLNMTPQSDFLNQLTNTANKAPLISIYGSEYSPIYLHTGSSRTYIAKYDDKTYPYDVTYPYSSSFYAFNPETQASDLARIKNNDKKEVIDGLQEADANIETVGFEIMGWLGNLVGASSTQQGCRDALKEVRNFVLDEQHPTNEPESQRLMNKVIGAVHLETRTYKQYTILRYSGMNMFVCNGKMYEPDDVAESNLFRKASNARQATGIDCYFIDERIPVYGWINYYETNTVQEESDGVVPNKMSVESAIAGVNDGNQFPAPPGLIAGIKVGANDGTNDNIGVNHSEMGNSLKVRNAIEKVLSGKDSKYRPDIFAIQKK